MEFTWSLKLVEILEVGNYLMKVFELILWEGKKRGRRVI
jgi:hypothetical protein